MKFLFIIHDNKQKNNVFPLGPAYLASVLREKGHEVSVYCMDVYHYTPSELKEFIEKNNFDAIGLGFLAARFDFVDEVCEAINSLEKKPLFIIGGPGPTPIPKYCLKRTNADIVLFGEGEDPSGEFCDGGHLHDWFRGTGHLGDLFPGQFCGVCVAGSAVTFNDVVVFSFFSGLYFVPGEV